MSDEYVFICRDCGEQFGAPVWHCKNCGHHYHEQDDNCHNCHQPKPETNRE